MSSNFNNEKPSSGKPQQVGRTGLGPGGGCKCSSCGHMVPHERGTPCTKVPCPKCGSVMYRE
ncbi:MAG: hypothetical protein GPJ51_08265 [Candidatus Heimdallarchaeota archaeon]|nr:hypothetical protein [Candidatus Heimdallarchaeota archaeon]